MYCGKCELMLWNGMLKDAHSASVGSGSGHESARLLIQLWCGCQEQTSQDRLPLLRPPPSSTLSTPEDSFRSHPHQPNGGPDLPGMLRRREEVQGSAS